MPTCNELNLQTFRVSNLDTYSDLDGDDLILVIESGSGLFSRKTTVDSLVSYVIDSGLTGSYTGSFSGSADLHGEFSGGLSGSFYGTSSHAVSASYALSASHMVTSSYSVTSSYALSSSHAVSSSHALLVDNAESSSYSVTSSYALTSSFAHSSSHAMTASYLLPPTTSTTVITSTVYFDRVTLHESMSYVNNLIAANTVPGYPTAVDGDWDVLSVDDALTTAGVTLPTTYPKVAILNVYHTSSYAIGDRNVFSFFTAHVDSSYGTRGSYIHQAGWGVGEDAGGGKDFFHYAGVYFARMSNTSGDLAVQYTRIANGGSEYYSDLVVDLIGVQY
jgi:hypothetical protein